MKTLIVDAIYGHSTAALTAAPGGDALMEIAAFIVALLSLMVSFGILILEIIKISKGA